MLVVLAWTTSLSAQITREQADEIVLQHIKNEVTSPYLLYVNVNAPSEAGVAITTFQEETFTAKYACWAYYLNENPNVTEPTQHRYLFVKANDGNLLEIITANDMVPDLTQWTDITTAIGELQSTSYELRVFPNPTTGQLTIYNEQLTIENIEIYDVHGVAHPLLFLPSFGGGRGRSDLGRLDVSHLANGVYFLRVGDRTAKFVKQ